MTADPGTYDATPADLALEREDAADEAKVQAWREAKADDYPLPGEYGIATLRYALDRTHEALGLPANRDAALAESVQAWRNVDRVEPVETKPWWDALYQLRDAADRYLDHVNGRAS